MHHYHNVTCEWLITSFSGTLWRCLTVLLIHKKIQWCTDVKLTNFITFVLNNRIIHHINLQFINDRKNFFLKITLKEILNLLLFTFFSTLEEIHPKALFITDKAMSILSTLGKKKLFILNQIKSNKNTVQSLCMFCSRIIFNIIFQSFFFHFRKKYWSKL